MDLFKIIGVGIITCIAILIVKQIKPEMAIVIGLAGGILMILMLVDSLANVISVFNILVLKSNLNEGLFTAVMKIIGVGYLTEFSSNLCADAGSSNIANKILLAGKVVILVIALPIVSNLIEIIVSILP